MSASSFGEALRRLLLDEGGNDDDPVDAGGRTSRGVTQATWDKWRKLHPERDLPEDCFDAPQAEVHALFKELYWDPMYCDSLPTGLDYTTFDYGVTSGIGRAPRVLQGLLGVVADGDVLTKTLAALSKANTPSLINQLNDERLLYLQDIVRRKPTQVKFIKGWTARVARVREASLLMAKNAAPPVAVQAKPKGLFDVLFGLFRRSGHATLPHLPAPSPERTQQAPTRPLPAPVGTEPGWFTLARSHIGFHEKGVNLGIEDFIDAAHTGSLGDPWCAIFVNAMFERNLVPGTRSAMARSFERDPKKFVRLSGPALGCVATFWRGSPTSGSGHVCFYAGTDEIHRPIGLGGNQSDSVSLSPMSMARHTGWWWPANILLPQVGPVPVVGKITNSSKET